MIGTLKAASIDISEPGGNGVTVDVYGASATELLPRLLGQTRAPFGQTLEQGSFLREIPRRRWTNPVIKVLLTLHLREIPRDHANLFAAKPVSSYP